MNRETVDKANKLLKECDTVCSALDSFDMNFNVNSILEGALGSKFVMISIDNNEGNLLFRVTFPKNRLKKLFDTIHLELIEENNSLQKQFVEL